MCHIAIMANLVVIGQQIKEKRRIVPPAYMVPKYPSLNRVKVCPTPSFTCRVMNLFDHIFKQGNVFIGITGNKTTEQNKN